MSVQRDPNRLPELTPAETAGYTRELLESLRKIALQQRQELLAHLLELAAVEAKTLAGAQLKPRTPDSPDAGKSAPPAPSPAEP